MHVGDNSRHGQEVRDSGRLRSSADTSRKSAKLRSASDVRETSMITALEDLVSAEGIESITKRTFNDMQVHG